VLSRSVGDVKSRKISLRGGGDRVNAATTARQASRGLLYQGTKMSRGEKEEFSLCVKRKGEEVPSKYAESSEWGL